MAQSADLYAILRGFALKNNSPYINVSVFLKFLVNYAQHFAQEQPEWAKWTIDTEKKFGDELTKLIERNKCSVVPDASGDRVYMPFFCLEKLREIYTNSDKVAEFPFPDEGYFKITIPASQVRFINLETNPETLFQNIEQNAFVPPESSRADNEIKALPSEASAETHLDELIQISFPELYGSALVPSGMMPRRLLEAAFWKLRGYLFSHGNKEFILHKMNPYLPGREKYLRDMVEQLMVQPGECVRNLESSGDSASLFWICFCSLIKGDIKSKKDASAELVSEDIAAIQATFIIEAYNGYYKTQDFKRRERDNALRNLDQHLERPPFYYTLNDILKFTNDKNVLLLDIYSKQDLDEHIKKRVSESTGGELPEWLVLQGKNNERGYIKKNKYLPLCTKMLTGIRPNIKKEVINRWLRLKKDFRTEPAMEQDTEFNRLLAAYTENENPTLMSLLDDPKLLLVYLEQERSATPIPAASRIFKAGKRLPLSTLYAFRRKDMLSDVKFMLPFWYSIPILAQIFGFFKNKGNRKQRSIQNRNKAAAPLQVQGAEGRTLQNTAQSIINDIVPQGLDTDEYLADLENQWSRLLDKDARRNLINDVRGLLRDNLRNTLKLHKTTQLSQKHLAETADYLIANTPALRQLGSGQILRKYIQLYMAKLLFSNKV